MDNLRTRLADARLYLCTDGRRSAGDLLPFLDAVLAGGVDIVQLREKGLEAGEEIELLEVFAAACARHGKLLAVNDRADVALAAGADVLHLGQDDLPVPVARRILGPGPLIGRSSHSPAQSSAAAAEDGVDYFCAGPVWATPTKAGRPGTGTRLLSHVASLSGGRPWFAIGGISLGRLDEVLQAGATRVVVVRAITEAEDPGAAAAAFAKRLSTVKPGQHTRLLTISRKSITEGYHHGEADRRTADRLNRPGRNGGWLSMLRTAGCALAAAAFVTGVLVAASPAARASVTMCQQFGATAVDRAGYTVQDDEWGSGAAECLATNGGADFTVTRSAIDLASGGDPGAYPSIYGGCNWGACTRGGLAAHPQRVSGLRAGALTSSLTTTGPAGGAYDVAYDIWLNRTPATSGAPNGGEIMVWLNRHGGVQPAGRLVSRLAHVGGYEYDVWYSPDAGNGPSLTYVMRTPRSAVSRIDIGTLARDTARRGVISHSSYVIAVEAGFEVWRGGRGLAVHHFSVAVAPGR